MNTFTPRESRLIEKLRNAPVGATLELKEPCPYHSVCNPLPLFRVYRASDEVFQAQWNTHHRKGPEQTFRFSEALKDAS